MQVAVLVDAAFFIRRYNSLVPGGKEHSGTVVAEKLHEWACRHLHDDGAGHSLPRAQHCELYRIFVYDCPPFGGGLHHPVSKNWIDFKKTDLFANRTNFHERLRQLRKVALRLGHLGEVKGWTIKAEVQDALLKGKRDLASLTESDVLLDTKQKGVDMRIGVDVASLAYKKQVDRIVLFAGDADFVPAAKLARREGLDFVLDSMHAPIARNLYEHIDGLVSMVPMLSERKDVKHPPKDFTIAHNQYANPEPRPRATSAADAATLVATFTNLLAPARKKPPAEPAGSSDTAQNDPSAKNLDLGGSGGGT